MQEFTTTDPKEIERLAGVAGTVVLVKTDTERYTPINRNDAEEYLVSCWQDGIILEAESVRQPGRRPWLFLRRAK